MITKMKFKSVGCGSKLVEYEVRWPDGISHHTARKRDSKTVVLLDGCGSGVSVLADPEEEVSVSEAPHQDGDIAGCQQ